MAVSVEFRKGIGKVKDATKNLNKAKKARPSNFDIPEVPDGTYICRVTVDADRNKNGEFYVSFKWKIAQGEYKNKGYRQICNLQAKNENQRAFAWDYVSKAIQVLMDMDEDQLAEFENWELSDICDVLDEIDKEAPYARCTIRTKKDGEYTNMDCYLNSLVNMEAEGQGEEEEEGEEGEEEESSEEEETEEEETEEETEEGEEEEEEEVTIEKGDTVLYLRGEYKVTSSNKAKETASLQGATSKNKSKKHTAVPWGKLTLVTED